MNTARFQPRGFLTFDLQSGQLSSRDEQRYLVVPAALVTAAEERGGLEEAARRWGEAQGAFLSELIGEGMLEESPERFATELSHLLASLGWGLCDFETWGAVLCVVARNVPGGGATEILNHFLAGVFTAVHGHRFESVPVRSDAEVHFVLTSPEGAGEVREWASEGEGIAEIARRMHAGEHLAAGIEGP